MIDFFKDLGWFLMFFVFGLLLTYTIVATMALVIL